MARIRSATIPLRFRARMRSSTWRNSAGSTASGLGNIFSASCGPPEHGAANVVELLLGALVEHLLKRRPDRRTRSALPCRPPRDGERSCCRRCGRSGARSRPDETELRILDGRARRSLPVCLRSAEGCSRRGNPNRRIRSARSESPCGGRRPRTPAADRCDAWASGIPRVYPRVT